MKKILLIGVIMAVAVSLFVTSDTVSSQESYYVAKFNASGTNIKDKVLMLRFDIYPPVASKSYVEHYVQVLENQNAKYPGKVDADGLPVDQKDFDNWYAAQPKIWRLNPMVCIFIKADPDWNAAQLANYITTQLDPFTLQYLDDNLSKESMTIIEWDILNAYMEPKLGKKVLLPASTDKEQLTATVNSRFDTLEVSLDAVEK